MSGQRVTREDIENRFNFHPATPARGRMHDNVRRLLKSTAMSLAGNLPPGREAALVVTKLEEAMFWANAAIARETEVGPEPVEVERVELELVTNEAINRYEEEQENNA